MLATIQTHVGEKGLGYIPDLSMPEDEPLRLVKAVGDLPDESPDWPLSPRTSDQGNLGSCTGNAVGDAAEDLDRRRGVDVEWSRLWPYLGGRLTYKHLTVDDYVRNPAFVRQQMSEDTGAMIRDVVAFVNAWGFISEALWPYVISKFADLPDSWTRAQAKRHRLLQKRYLNTAEELRVAIHEKHPVVLGFTVYQQFNAVGADGEYRRTSGSALGGHAVRVVKHVASKVVPGFSPGAALIRNSWGAGWGCAHPTMAALIPGKGFFWMPDEVIDSADVSDIWAFVED